MVHRCIKPQCPTDCSECNHALPEEDEVAMLVCDLLDAFAVDGFDGPLEDGESQLVDRARAWLATRHCASLPELPTCTKSQTAEIERLKATVARVEAVTAEFEGMTGSGYRYMAAHVRDAIKAPNAELRGATDD